MYDAGDRRVILSLANKIRIYNLAYKLVCRQYPLAGDNVVTLIQKGTFRADIFLISEKKIKYKIHRIFKV